ncbi:Bacterial alpha-L-rhamnosidase [Seonamhaeicola maritimus]|uniref:Bacterial alpha-L-rhamnosidase n=1 Tax=Seonamhaeicola maritimus TaxID=2591822 RepID=A0A5C7GL95_9FLAO|nr:Bacterial alpha-L-rhamnosidase [Seonamhaeicola maritimus]
MHKNIILQKWKFWMFFIICFQFCCLAQEISELPNGVKGFWTQGSLNNDFLNDWKAQWIWLPESVKNDVMLARRNFTLSKKPESSKFLITASSKYELYINGTYICQGPARSAPHHQSFDIFDVSSLLIKGENCIAVRVHYQRGTTSYHLNGRAGLLVQLDIEDETKTKSIVSDENWKVHPDLSWDSNSKPISRFQLVVNDNINLNQKITGFELINFDDSKWSQGLPLLRNSGWPSPKKDEKAKSLTTPWTSLIPRDIPYLNETDITPIKLIEAKQVPIEDIEKASILLSGGIQKEVDKSYEKYLKGKAPLSIQLSETDKVWFLLFDFGKVISGMPKLEIKGVKNTEVSILSAPFIVGDVFTHHIVASNFKDELVLSGKKDTWQAMYFKPARYMAVVIKGSPVEIYDLSIHQLEYPFELKGHISTPEAPWIEALWEASVKTINTCTTDAFTDNYRERRQYAQTGYYAAKGNYFTYGDFALQRRYLIQVAQEQEAGGLMPAYAPLTGDDYMVILDSNCLWVRSLHDYLLYSGDFDTVKELLPSAKKLMSLLHSYTNGLGVLDSPPYAYWLDHALNDRRGANLCLNGHYQGALKDFSKILEWLEDEHAQLYRNRALLLKESVRTQFWDANKELFVDAVIDGEQSKMFSEHANAMALAEGIATQKQAKVISKFLLAKDKHNFIKRENGVTMVTPAMSYFLHKGLADYSNEEAALNMLNTRFGHMLEPHANGTLWEEWWRNGTGRIGKFQERTRSDAQTESAFPPALFAKYVLGVEVTKPGMSEVVIKRRKVNLFNIDGEIPSPHGILTVSWDIGNESSLNLNIPEGMLIKIDLDSFNLEDKKGIFINGEKINNSNFLELRKGSHKISF